MPEGRQSPPPSRQTGAQQQDPPSNGQGLGSAENKDETLKSEVENLGSNPKHPLQDGLDNKFSKGTGNCKCSIY